MTDQVTVLTSEDREYQALARTEISANCRTVLSTSDYDPLIVEQIVGAMIEYLAGEAMAGLPVDIALRAVCLTYLEPATPPESADMVWIVQAILDYLDAEVRAAGN